MNDDCVRARGYLPEWADGELSSAQTSWVEGHWEECAACRGERIRFKGFDGRLLSLGEKIMPPVEAARLSRGVSEAEDMHHSQPDLGPRHAGRKPGGRAEALAPLTIIPAALLVAAAVLVLVLLPHRAVRVVVPDEGGFVPVPFVPPIASYERSSVVSMQISVATLLAQGYRIAADPSLVLQAYVLLGEDGRMHAVRLAANQVLMATGLYAQAPQFEVVSMKAVPPGEPMRARTSDGAQLHYPSVSLLSLLREAWRLKTPEQVDGPPWMRTQLYNVQATLPENASKDQIPEMLQALLADRLKLSVHHEMRPLPTNVLVAGSLKMRRVDTGGDEGLELNLDVPLVKLSGRGSIAQLIDQLNHGLGGPHPWVDMTGLSGFFEIRLAFDMTSASSVTPALPQALEEQLGLRVEVRKTPTDVVVVDHVEKIPAEN